MANASVEKLGFNYEEEMHELNEDRHAAIEPLFAQYHAGQHKTTRRRAQATENIRLVSSSDLNICTGSREIRSCDDIRDFSVSLRSDPSAVNFMGHNHERRCLAFKGETRFLEQFLDFTSDVFRCASVEIAFKAPTQVAIPPKGLPPGLSYEQFAGRVEIVEYAMWLKGSPDDAEHPGVAASINVRPIANDHSSPISMPDPSPEVANKVVSNEQADLGDLGTLPDSIPEQPAAELEAEMETATATAPPAPEQEAILAANAEPDEPLATTSELTELSPGNSEMFLPSEDAVSALVAEQARERYSLRTRSAQAVDAPTEVEEDKKKIKLKIVSRNTPVEAAPFKQARARKRPAKKATTKNPAGKKAPVKKAPAKPKGKDS